MIQIQGAMVHDYTIEVKLCQRFLASRQLAMKEVWILRTAQNDERGDENDNDNDNDK